MEPEAGWNNHGDGKDFVQESNKLNGEKDLSQRAYWGGAVDFILQKTSTDFQVERKSHREEAFHRNSLQA